MQRYNLARFDLVSIRLVALCAQRGSLSAAARELHLAIAAASRRIKELEDALRTTLFDRHARGITPTAAGLVFVKHALQLLSTMEHLGDELTDLSTGVGQHISLCASTAAINQFLPPLLQAYAQAFPYIKIDLEEQVSEAVTASLRSGLCDVGVFVEGPDITGLSTAPFRSDRLVLVLPKNHLLARSKLPIAFVDTLGENYVGLNAGAAMLHRQQQTALAHGRTFKLRMQVRSFDAVCHLVASGLGVALLPATAAKPLIKAMQLTTRPLADPWSERTMLVACVAEKISPEAKKFMQFLAQPNRSQNAKAASLIRK
jgi:DNA-binding transcriptional LysR family regulator